MNLDGQPWFEPPEWWRDGMIDGLTWEELLAREWTAALNAPPTPRELEMREMARKMGQAAAQVLTDTAIQVLMEWLE
jgi:hypothetical protein